MINSKPLGEKSRIADSILRYTVKHERKFENALDLYNGWVSETMNEGFSLKTSSDILFALEQAEACMKTPLEQLIVCKEIEDGIKKTFTKRRE